jgi:hypothetical protein
MRALSVVLPLPGRKPPAHVEQIAEATGVHALVAQFFVEAFHLAVLHRAARLNVQEIDLPLDTPTQKWR